jgi:predicted enzyme related to lactoylglutathione lyase
MDKVVHFHMPVDDMERARRFYMNIFGWDFQGTGYPEYQLATTVDTDENDIPKEPGAINGALYTRESPEEYPEITIEVSSIEDYLKKIEKSGGKIITKKTPVKDLGFYAEFRDTENNIVGLWQEPT